MKRRRTLGKYMSTIFLAQSLAARFCFNLFSIASINSRVTTHDSRSVLPHESARSYKVRIFRRGSDLGHDGVFVDCIDTSLLDGLSKHNQFLISIKFTPMFKTS